MKFLLLFYKRNLLRILPFAVIVLFSIFGILISDALISSYFETVHFYTGFLKTSAVIICERNSPEIETVIEDDTPILKTYAVDYHYGSINLLGMDVRYPILGVRKTDLEELMTYYQVRLKKGRIFTEGEKEIILTEEAVKHKKKNLGKKFRVYGTGEDYRIVGILEGKTAIGFYPVRSYELSERNKLMTFKNPLELTKNREFVWGIYDAYWKRYKLGFSCYTVNKYWEDMERKTTHLIKVSFNIGIIVNVVVYTLIALFINLFYFRRRLPEYGLLLAVGLNKFALVKKAFYENLGLLLLSWMSGVILSRVILEILKIKIFIPQGWLIRTFSVGALPYTIPVPAGMLFCAVLVVIYKLRELDPVEIIERRW